MNRQKTLRAVALVGLTLAMTGCQAVKNYSLTYRLWENSDMRKFSEPAPKANLALFETSRPPDLLVQYDALSEQHSTVTRRAYFVSSNQARIGQGKKPQWINPSMAAGMKPIPVLPTPTAVTNLPPALPKYAVMTKNGRGFALHQAGNSQETFELPVYAETSGTPTRIALTPLTLAADTAIVAVTAAVVGFVLWVQSGAPVQCH